eukprot:gene8810-18075_t
MVDAQFYNLNSSSWLIESIGGGYGRGEQEGPGVKRDVRLWYHLEDGDQ